ncbi:MAG: hypothetical protein KGY80_07215 [Candidatus Thorarchaeota archaeon]|nr:hypothetical protein [Candidatus Thorarchaeota archaeon]
MSGMNLWKLKSANNVKSFHDIRMKVGNKVIRAYLLDRSFEENRIEKEKLSLRGPKDEFFDAAKFLVLKTGTNEEEYAFLIQAGVYSNLRIVGVDNDNIIDLEPDEIVDMVTEPLENPSEYDSRIVLSRDTKITGSN